MSEKVFLRYLGPYDERILFPVDLAKVGVDEGFNQTKFYKGRASAVTADVAMAIISNPELFGKFEQVEKNVKVVKEENESSESETTDTTANSTTKPKNR